jgi:hypothetical protein
MKILKFLAICTALTAPLAHAERGTPNVSIEERAKGAKSVLVGKIRHSRAEHRRNEKGDELIVTHHEVAVDESLKGSSKAGSSVDVVVEGGTVGDTTLVVSDLPALKEGEEVAMFLDDDGDDAKGGLKPHRRGLGILRLEHPTGGKAKVRNTGLTLESLRQKVRAGK